MRGLVARGVAASGIAACSYVFALLALTRRAAESPTCAVVISPRVSLSRHRVAVVPAVCRSSASSSACSRAKARSEAWETRKKTLGVEARQDGKSNSFLDRRFGEQDDVTEEDKMLMRFQRERMARIKKGAFDLDEDEEDILTHKGQLLGAMTKDDFSAEILKSHCLIGMY